MDINLYSAKLQAKVLSLNEKAKEAYEKDPERSAYWQFIDLCDSSNIRIKCGARDGYLRNELFFSLIDEVTSPCNDVFLIKEIGDEVFLTSPAISRLVESTILIINAIESLERLVPQADKYPFKVRTAIGFGPAKKIVRPGKDYIGEAIDSLSRLMNIKEGSGFIIEESAYALSKGYIDDYRPLISTSDVKMLPSTLSKNLATKLYFREIYIDMQEVSFYKKNFMPWA